MPNKKFMLWSSDEYSRQPGVWLPLSGHHMSEESMAQIHEDATHGTIIARFCTFDPFAIKKPKSIRSEQAVLLTVSADFGEFVQFIKHLETQLQFGQHVMGQGIERYWLDYKIAT